MDVGLAFDLPPALEPGAPPDSNEEYDSQQTIDAIAAALSANGYAPRFLGGGRMFIEAMLASPPDIVFNMAESSGPRSREAHVPSVCEMLGVPYTGSDPLTLAATLDKAVAKRLVGSHGLATPSFVIAASDEIPTLPFDFPVLAKPLHEGSGMGLVGSSRITSPVALKGHVERLRRDHRQPVLIEEFLPGAELTVGITGNGDETAPIGVMEITPLEGSPEKFVYSVEMKHIAFDALSYRKPLVPASVVEDALALAMSCYRVLECLDIARIDLRCRADGSPQFIEANPIPGLKPGWGDIVVLAELYGVAYDDLIGGIMADARKRLGI